MILENINTYLLIESQEKGLQTLEMIDVSQKRREGIARLIATQKYGWPWKISREDLERKLEINNMAHDRLKKRYQRLLIKQLQLLEK